MEYLRIFGKAIACLKTAKWALVQVWETGDVSYFPIAKTHFVAAIGYVMAGYLSAVACETLDHTDLDRLHSLIDKYSGTCTIPYWLNENLVSINNLKYGSLSTMDFFDRLLYLKRLSDKIDEFFKDNGVQEELNVEITQSVKEVLIEKTNVTRKPKYDYEWNLLYKLEW